MNNRKILLDIRRDVQAGQGDTSPQHQSVSMIFSLIKNKMLIVPYADPSKVSAR